MRTPWSARAPATTRLAVRRVAVTTAFVLALASVAGCGDEPTPAAKPAAPAEAVPAAAEGAAAAKPAAPKPPPKRAERPLPAFSGWTLAGQRLEISSLIGKRLLLVFFNPEVKEASTVIRAVNAVAPLRGKQNFEIVGIAMGSSREKAVAFGKANGIDFRVIDDSAAAISRRLGLRTPLAMLGIDPEGYVVFGFGQFPTEAPDAEKQVEAQIRTAMRLPAAGATDAAPGFRPVAPTFKARRLDSDEPFDLAAHRGEPVVLVFFLHTCPHCHELLTWMKQELAQLPEDKRPLFVGLEVTGKTQAVRAELKRLGLDYFPVIFDDGGSIASAYGVFGGVPDTFGIDANGRIAWRIQGWAPETAVPLTRMRLAKLSGAPVPMLLRTDGYTGSEACGVCHQPQHDTWSLTRHAHAFDTLVKHGASANGECVSCHVVGFDRPGGYTISPPTPHLEDVGCESCHGRGGPHLSPGFTPPDSYETACVTCHDTKHSLGFDYATFLPKISHAANAYILELPAEERRRVLAERGAIRSDLLPVAAHVGSEACKSCHPAEYETWAAGPHAAALGSLVAKGKQADADCQACHTTGFGRDGGFPKGAAPADHADLARVGCESCHGPGGNHVGEDAPKFGTVVALGDKCDSCVILQICGRCHDDANDPGFEFEVVEKIDKIRHGTIEPGTGRKLAPGERLSSPAAPHDASDVHALLAYAFRLSEDR